MMASKETFSVRCRTSGRNFQFFPGLSLDVSCENFKKTLFSFDSLYTAIHRDCYFAANTQNSRKKGL